ncbi:MAG: enoyl-CoA hydratase-related protein [Pygmaiobacter sp.]
MDTVVQLAVRQQIATLSINRPEALNALSREIVDELDAALERISADTAIKVLVLRSAGNFAAGADIKQMVECTPEQAKKFSFSPTYQKLAGLAIPTIAAIEGYALGGGMELALCCDMRIAMTNAKMGFPEIGLGIMPGAGGTVRLPKLIGAGNAAEMILTGRTIHAEEALHMGLVNSIVAPEDFDQKINRLAQRIAAHSGQALRTAKRSIKFGLDTPDEELAIAQESELWCSLFESYNQKEGMIAFLEKREPHYDDKE